MVLHHWWNLHIILPVQCCCSCEWVGGRGGSQVAVAFLLSFRGGGGGSFIFGQKSIHVTVTLNML